ncbi:MAG: hypothetical protein ACRC2T_19160 [Thermoguttaceae bacterium]
MPLELYKDCSPQTPYFVSCGFQSGILAVAQEVADHTTRSLCGALSAKLAVRWVASRPPGGTWESKSSLEKPRILRKFLVIPGEF